MVHRAPNVYTSLRPQYKYMGTDLVIATCVVLKCENDGWLQTCCSDVLYSCVGFHIFHAVPETHISTLQA